MLLNVRDKRTLKYATICDAELSIQGQKTNMLGVEIDVAIATARSNLNPVSLVLYDAGSLTE